LLTKRKTLALGTFLLAMIMAVGAYSAAVAPKTSTQEVSEGLTCQCGCGLTVANCNHPQCEFAVPVRTQIDKMIANGMTRPQIVAWFRTDHRGLQPRRLDYAVRGPDCWRRRNRFRLWPLAFEYARRSARAGSDRS
jgi:hypothetical protein